MIRSQYKTGENSKKFIKNFVGTKSQQSLKTTSSLPFIFKNSKIDLSPKMDSLRQSYYNTSTNINLKSGSKKKLDNKIQKINSDKRLISNK